MTNTSEKKTVVFQKIEPGKYRTKDGRFHIINTYASVGIPGRQNLSKDNPWLVTDDSGKEPFHSSFTQSKRKSFQRYQTLSEVREAIAQIYRIEEQEHLLLNAGYIRVPNLEFPDRCWKSPNTETLLTLYQAVKELKNRG